MTQGIEARCSGCGEPIRFRFTPSGKRMPLNAQPHEGPIGQGCYVIESVARCRPADPLFDQDKTFYMNHWATCEDAELFRRSPAARKDDTR